MHYAVERYPEIAAELAPLVRLHWEEVALDKESIQVELDDDRYRLLDTQENLVIITARAGGKLVGYIAAIVSKHLHYARTLFGYIDVFWLAPEHRAGTNGIRLFVELERELRRRGVRKMIGQTKLGPKRDMSSLYQFLGWTHVENLFSKVVGGVTSD